MKALHQLTEGYSKRPRRQVGNIIVSIKDIQLMGNSQKKESKKKWSWWSHCHTMLKGSGENCMKSRTGLCVTIFFVICSSVLSTVKITTWFPYSLAKYFVSW